MEIQKFDFIFSKKFEIRILIFDKRAEITLASSISVLH